MGQRLAVWLWPWDLKINRDLLLSRDNYCTKFGNSQVKGSKDIEQRTSVHTPAVWPWPLSTKPKIQ